MDKIKSELLVAALENGTVIDHIPSDKVFAVVNLLGLQNLSTPITIGANLKSNKMERKGIIKISEKYFTKEEVSKLSVIAPNIVLNIIKNYEVAEKVVVSMPEEVTGIIKCYNPTCITNHDPMATIFKVVDKQNGTLRCYYCGKDISKNDIKLI